jgi:hydroxypyruvate isomerase
MPKFAVNLSMLFTSHDFLDRFEAAANAGFSAVEYLFPYDYPPEEIASRLEKHNLKQVLFNLPAGDWNAGERGITCSPSRTEEFKRGVDDAIKYAKALNCNQVNCLAGIAEEGLSANILRSTFVSNLRYAAERLEREGLTLLIESINTRDIPGFFLNRTEQALRIIKEVDASNLKVQYDIYHMQIMEGDLAHTIQAHINEIGHIQLADNPGRHEPGTGEINYPFLFKHLDAIGYDGWIGCEYVASDPDRPEASFGWRP